MRELLSPFDLPEERSPATAPVLDAAKSLWNVLGSPFRGDIRPEGYSARMTLSALPSRHVMQSGILRDHIDQYSDISGLDRQKPWTLGISYIPEQEKLGLTSVGIPVYGTQPGQEITYHRSPYENGFITAPPTYDSLSRRDPLSDKPFDKQFGRQDDLVPTPFIEDLLGSAGYMIPTLPTNPTDLRLTLAGIADSCDHVTITQNLHTVPANGVQQTALRQMTTLERMTPDLMGPDVDVAELAIDQALSDGARRTCTDQLQAVCTDTSPVSGGLKQTVVGFQGSDYRIHKMSINSQTIKPYEYPALDNGSLQGEVIEKLPLPLTPDLMGSLAADAQATFKQQDLL